MKHSTQTLVPQQLRKIPNRAHAALHSGPHRLCRTSAFHKAYRQITGSLGLGSHDGSIQPSY